MSSGTQDAQKLGRKPDRYRAPPADRRGRPDRAVHFSAVPRCARSRRRWRSAMRSCRERTSRPACPAAPPSRGCSRRHGCRPRSRIRGRYTQIYMASRRIAQAPSRRHSRKTGGACLPVDRGRSDAGRHREWAADLQRPGPTGRAGLAGSVTLGAMPYAGGMARRVSGTAKLSGVRSNQPAYSAEPFAPVGMIVPFKTIIQHCATAARSSTSNAVKRMRFRDSMTNANDPDPI